MGDVVNLRTFRKRAVRQKQEEDATRRRAEYGVAKNDRELASARDSKIRRNLDLHRLDTGDGE